MLLRQPLSQEERSRDSLLALIFRQPFWCLSQSFSRAFPIVSKRKKPFSHSKLHRYFSLTPDPILLGSANRRISQSVSIPLMLTLSAIGLELDSKTDSIQLPAKMSSEKKEEYAILIK